VQEQLARAIEQDFLEWSGGFPPDSEEQIFVYVETSSPIDTDSQEVSELLRTWMRREDAAAD